MQGNGLVANNVVAGRQFGGDGDGSGDVRDEPRCPGPSPRSSPGVHLDLLRRRFVDDHAVGPVAGDAVDVWALVAGGPGVPLERHLAVF